MSTPCAATREIAAVERLMLRHFAEEPFHNLRLIYPEIEVPARHGGTCSDKTLSFVEDARRAGHDVHLHSGFIGGKEIHRLARVHIAGSNYFADVGNGWPALQLYPSDADHSFGCFGMRFRSVVTGAKIRVFHEKCGRESLQLEIDRQAKSEAEVLDAIAARFSTGIEYPFSTQIRFSRVVDQRFLFLRDDVLEIHSGEGFQRITDIGASDVPAVLRDHLGFELISRGDGRAVLRRRRGPVQGTGPQASSGSRSDAAGADCQPPTCDGILGGER